MISSKTTFLRTAGILLTVFLFTRTVWAQGIQLSTKDLNYLLQIPKHYTVFKTDENMVIDGKDDERSWSEAPWTDWFTDIVTGEKSPFMGRTRCKMLWDDHYLYVYAQMQETDIHATFKIHDQPVFTENAFEMYLDPDGSTHNYFEFQMNALGTTCDLFLPKPYRNGGMPLYSWDYKGLKKAVYVDGTLNNPTDTDKYWSIELAVPFSSVVMGHQKFPKAGTIWRMNLSRVEWPVTIKDGNYVLRTKGAIDWNAGHYTTWSPQGLVNLHYPERWGYIIFSDKKDTSDFLSGKDESIKLILWKYYYLQQIYQSGYGHYAISIDQLNNAFPKEAGTEDSRLQMEATPHQFGMECYLPVAKEYISVNEGGDLEEHSQQ